MSDGHREKSDTKLKHVFWKELEKPFAPLLVEEKVEIDGEMM